MDNEELVKDPVCGMVKPVSQMQATTTYKGETYFFCTQMDKQAFDAHPEHWAPKEGEKK
ncbi:MAG: YHS domain protein [Candidatus Woesebacteria bacterium GW2011_GWB1_45_5]|uniref:YHS domain protein n=1 Tax=Candidatus Woesebacteria bacterium GW2011_GWB1_45_5 TaxID=1618581 RepID=A0A0G1PWR5_9BACT|nr:MAG: YHS domain protein [Candidatus Woesebacteria bacterium GW2011_GWB1_45_5]